MVKPDERNNWPVLRIVEVIFRLAELNPDESIK